MCDCSNPSVVREVKVGHDSPVEPVYAPLFERSLSAVAWGAE